MIIIIFVVQGQNAGQDAKPNPFQDMPEWKKSIIGGSKGSYGKKTSMSILDQRQSLPIYKLKVSSTFSLVLKTFIK